MADDITDVYIATEVGNAGWQSLSALAAAQVEVDAELPISDADGTVKIWSAAADYINFDTGGVGDFKMDPDANFTANGRIISKATGVTNVAFGTEDGNNGFALIANGFPGMVSNGEQVQNYNYSELLADASGDVYQRYQSTVKARKGPTSYSELMFLSDDSQNKGLRFLACGSGVKNVSGWPILAGDQSLGFDSAGVSALLHNGYLIEGSSPNKYTPLVIGCQTRSDLVFMADSSAFMTLKPGINEIELSVPLNAAVVKNDLIVNGKIQTDLILSSVGAVNDPSIAITDHVTICSNQSGADTSTVATFSSFTGSSQRGLHIKNGVNAGSSNSRVELDARSDTNVGLIALQTDGNDVLLLGKETTSGSKPIDIKAFDGYIPQSDNSLATQKTVNDKIWVGTTAQYLAIDARDILNSTLYCLTD